MVDTGRQTAERPQQIHEKGLCSRTRCCAASVGLKKKTEQRSVQPGYVCGE